MHLPAVLWAARSPRPNTSVPALLIWAVVIVVTYLGGSLFERLGFPAPHLMTGLAVGLLVAVTGLARRTSMVLPKIVYIGGQGVVGVLLGTYFSLNALGKVGWSLIPLVMVTLITLLLSIGAGLWLARHSPLDESTATLGLVAGGSAGIVATADDLGADARVVAVLQYVRLIVVVVSAPLLVRYVLAPNGLYAAVGAKEIEAVASIHGYVLTTGIAAVGAYVGHKLKIPAGALIVPLLITAIGGGVGLWNDLQPPELIREPAFIIIGLAVGLGFDMFVLRKVVKSAPNAFLAIVGIIVTCGLLSVLIAATTHVSLLNAYLATTPGGINAVLVTAFAAGANTSLVFGIQGLRLVIMVLAAPILIRWLVARKHVAHRGPR